MKLKSIPVTVGFNRKKVIGTLTIDEEALPERPDFHLAIGGKANHVEDGQILGFEITEVGLVSDRDFMPMRNRISK
jgi:hypothetical protein